MKVRLTFLALVFPMSAMLLSVGYSRTTYVLIEKIHYVLKGPDEAWAMVGFGFFLLLASFILFLWIICDQHFEKND
ncbi:MAG: hypothetical protein V3W19_00390 [Desulfatiglandales bacterium]